MKKIILLILIISIFGTIVYATNTVIEEKNKKIELRELENQLNMVISDTSEINDKLLEDPMFDLLKEIYINDKLNEAAGDYATLKVIEDISQADSVYLYTLISEKRDYFNIIEVYKFWKTTCEPIEIVSEIYDRYDEFYDITYWVEEVYNLLTENKHGVLTTVQVKQYLKNEKITVEDIQFANILSRKGVYTIEEILNLKLKGEKWQNIFNSVYKDIKISDKKTDYSPVEIINAKKMSEKTGMDISKYLKEPQLTAEYLNIYVNNASNKAVRQLHKKGKIRSLNLNEENNREFREKMIEKIKEKGISDSEIKKFKDDGYDEVSIYNAAVASKNKKTDIEKILKNNENEQ